MAEGKNTFNLYADMIGVFEALPDEKAGQLIKHIFRYVNDQNPETDDLVLSIAFEPIKAKLKRDLVKWIGVCEKNRKNANIRWDKENATACEPMPNDAKNADKDKDKDKDKINTGNVSQKKKFVPPTIADVEEYAKGRDRKVDPEKFWHAYDVNNWMVGKDKMKDWKKAFVNWEVQGWGSFSVKPEKPKQEGSIYRLVSNG